MISASCHVIIPAFLRIMHYACDELWNPIIADGEDQESAVSFTAPQFARLQALCEYLQRPLRNLQAPQDPAPAGDAQ